MPPAPTKYTDLISSSVMTFMFFLRKYILTGKSNNNFWEFGGISRLFLMFVSARHIFVAQDRRQTAECPDTDGDKRILKRQGLIGTQRHVFFPRTRPIPTSERGSRRKRIWGQRRTRLGADADAPAPRFADGHRKSENRLESAGSGLQRGKNGLGLRKSGVKNPEKIKLSGSALAAEICAAPAQSSVAAPAL